MKSLLLALLVFISLTFIACGGNNENDNRNTNTTRDNTTNTTSNSNSNSNYDAPNSFKATFVNFELGDAAHFLFEDENGERWDFGESMVTNYIFEAETADGFGPNPDLQNKTFMLTYEIKEQPLYVDGPIGEVKIITGAELVE